MTALPDRPFVPKDFSLRGGGIDFLGLRWVNLTIVGRDLIPELNNVTADMGTFFLGAWIPWKFKKLCSNDRDYTEKNYQAFREKVEVALALTFRNEEGIDRKFGEVRNRVGNTQKISLPSPLSFKEAKRTKQNSLYAAAIYGPSLQYLGFIKTYHSQAKGGAKSLNIPVPADDSDALEIFRGVDASLQKASCYERLASFDATRFTQKDISQLSQVGLDPAWFRSRAYAKIKKSFRRKLLPSDSHEPGYPRTLTARLLLETVRQRPQLTVPQIRAAWYTGMFEDGKSVATSNQLLNEAATRRGKGAVRWLKD